MIAIVVGIAVCGIAACIDEPNAEDRWSGFAIGSTLWTLINIVMV